MLRIKIQGINIRKSGNRRLIRRTIKQGIRKKEEEIRQGDFENKIQYRLQLVRIGNSREETRKELTGGKGN